MLPAPPFVLLDDAREDGGGGPARLYQAPSEIVSTASIAEVRPALAAIREAVGKGRHAAGFIAYEAGAAFVEGTPMHAPSGPLLWFGLFDRVDTLDAAKLSDPAGAWAGPPVPAIGRDNYDAAIAEVLDLIGAGDIYQANLTFRARVALAGDPLAIYARMRAQSAARYGAIIATGDQTILSLSPELFFAADCGTLTCRPMKGTAARGPTAAADSAAAAALARDPKQRAENLMIVDLMRNDLSRVAVPGSVAVPALFTVETYPTVHQLTSTITATLAPGKDATDVIAALFPCGSITGAPKRRAMEVIGQVEPDSRGLYTGAIGHIAPGGDAMFNVAIRTLSVDADGHRATLGLGSGITADSRADDEWEECLAKGAFVTAGQRRFDLIETMAFDPHEGLIRLDLHLARMKASATALGFRFDRHAARNDLQAATFRLREMRRVRLLLAASGAVAIEVGAMPQVREDAMTVAIVPLPVASDDFRLRHKTSDRAFYDDSRTAAGTDEVVFERPDGRLTEGSFTTLFVRRDDGMLVTPPLGAGLLPGVLRAQLIDDGLAVEGDLTRDDLRRGVVLGNSLRGLHPAIVAVAKAPSPSL